MPKRGKKYRESSSKIESTKRYDFTEAIDAAISSSMQNLMKPSMWLCASALIPDMPTRWFVEPSSCPMALEKKSRSLFSPKGEKEMEAKEAGAEFVGNEDLVEKIKEGWFGFDKAIATPDMMGTVGKIGRLLGPRGLMPNAKTGTVTFDVAKTVQELKAGKIEFGLKRPASFMLPMGKVSFGSQKLVENISAFLETIMKLKPSSSKGTYLKGIAVSTTMGPGIKIDTHWSRIW
jgi:large subunit ribosomal protein L1